MKKKEGFTLIELLVVVLIIGIIAAIALPQYQVAVLKSKLATVMQNVKSIKDAEEVYYLINNQYTEDLELLDVNLTGCNKQTDRFGPIFLCKNNTILYRYFPQGDESEIIGALLNGSNITAFGRIAYRHPLDKPGKTPLSEVSICRIDDKNDKIAAKVCSTIGKKQVGTQDWSWD